PLPVEQRVARKEVDCPHDDRGQDGEQHRRRHAAQKPRRARTAEERVRYRRREGHPESLGPAPGSAPWLSGLVPRTRLFVRVPSREQDKQARNRHHDDPGKLRGQRESEREPRNEEAPPRGAVEVAAEQGEKESAEEGHTYVGGDQLSVRGDR